MFDAAHLKEILNDHKRARSLYEAFFDRCVVGLAVVAKTGELLRVNTAFADLLDYPTTELEHYKWQDITKVSDIRSDTEAVTAVLEGKMAHYTMFKKYRSRANIDIPVRLTVFGWKDPEAQTPVAFLMAQIEKDPTPPQPIQELSIKRVVDTIEKVWSWLKEHPIISLVIILLLGGPIAKDKLMWVAESLTELLTLLKGLTPGG
jgi:PAS domain S-box-containing protein